jgi:hypothetical protein
MDDHHHSRTRTVLRTLAHIAALVFIPGSMI